MGEGLGRAAALLSPLARAQSGTLALSACKGCCGPFGLPSLSSIREWLCRVATGSAAGACDGPVRPPFPEATSGACVVSREGCGLGVVPSSTRRPPILDERTVVGAPRYGDPTPPPAPRCASGGGPPTPTTVLGCCGGARRVVAASGLLAEAAP